MEPIDRSYIKTNNGESHLIKTDSERDVSTTTKNSGKCLLCDRYCEEGPIYVSEIHSMYFTSLNNLVIGSLFEEKETGTIQNIYIERIDKKLKIVNEHSLKELMVNQSHKTISIVLLGTPNIEKLKIQGPINKLELDALVYYRFKEYIDNMDIGMVHLQY